MVHELDVVAHYVATCDESIIILSMSANCRKSILTGLVSVFFFLDLVLKLRRFYFAGEWRGRRSEETRREGGGKDE